MTFWDWLISPSTFACFAHTGGQGQPHAMWPGQACGAPIRKSQWRDALLSPSWILVRCELGALHSFPLRAETRRSCDGHPFPATGMAQAHLHLLPLISTLWESLWPL